MAGGRIGECQGVSTCQWAMHTAPLGLLTCSEIPTKFHLKMQGSSCPGAPRGGKSRVLMAERLCTDRGRLTHLLPFTPGQRMREPPLRKTWEYSNITKPLISYERLAPGMPGRSYQTKPGLPSGCQVNIKCFYAKSTCLGSRTVDNYNWAYLWLISHDLSHGVPLMYFLHSDFGDKSRPPSLKGHRENKEDLHLNLTLSFFLCSSNTCWLSKAFSFTRCVLSSEILFLK
jgi:hypothetical protein